MHSGLVHPDSGPTAPAAVLSQAARVAIAVVGPTPDVVLLGQRSTGV